MQVEQEPSFGTPNCMMKQRVVIHHVKLLMQEAKGP